MGGVVTLLHTVELVVSLGAPVLPLVPHHHHQSQLLGPMVDAGLDSGVLLAPVRHLGHVAANMDIVVPLMGIVYQLTGVNLAARELKLLLHLLLLPPQLLVLEPTACAELHMEALLVLGQRSEHAAVNTDIVVLPMVIVYQLTDVNLVVLGPPPLLRRPLPLASRSWALLPHLLDLPKPLQLMVAAVTATPLLILAQAGVWENAALHTDSVVTLMLTVEMDAKRVRRLERMALRSARMEGLHLPLAQSLLRSPTEVPIALLDNLVFLLCTLVLCPMVVLSSWTKLRTTLS